ncbi:MAG: phosphatase PAP2 family protein [Isosphaeraceae bacterium]
MSLSWWFTVAVFVALFVLGLGLGEVVGADGQVREDSLDQRVTAWVVAHRPVWPGLTRLLLAASRIGDWEVGLPLVIGISILLTVLNRSGTPGIRRAEIGLWIIAIVGAQLLCNGLKAWFQRERPPLLSRLVVEDSSSFPSGHSLTSSACFAVAAVLLVRALSDSSVWLRIVAVWLCGTLIGLIAVSRVWLGVHYLSDVLSGLVLGLAWAFAVCVIHFGRTRPGPLIPKSEVLDSNL